MLFESGKKGQAEYQSEFNFRKMTNKRLFYFILFLAFFTSLWSGCDIVEPPYLVGEDTEIPDDGEVVRKFLLEEFTGHQCPNCPVGSEEAKILKNFYGDRLVIVSVHAGWFARTTGGDFSYDFTTPEGEELNSYFGIEQNPVGLVNRLEFEGSMLLGPTAWGSAMAVLDDLPPAFSINLEAEKTGNSYELSVEVKALEDLEPEYYLVAMVIEDGIVSPQKINSSPDYPDGIIMDYEHNHVLRKGITNIWGEKLNEQPLTSGDIFERDYTFSPDSEWVTDNCHMVVYVMSQTMEVMQVEEIPFP